MEVKRICQWCGKPFIAQKTTTNYCSPQCSKRGYKHRMKERRMELIQSQDLLEVKKRLENQEYFTFSQAAKLMGVSRQYIYKLVKEDKLRASRISSRMSFIRRTDIELLLKSKPYERVMSKVEFDIAEYYTAEEIAEKYVDVQPVRHRLDDDAAFAVVNHPVQRRRRELLAEAVAGDVQALEQRFRLLDAFALPQNVRNQLKAGDVRTIRLHVVVHGTRGEVQPRHAQALLVRRFII